MHRPAKLVLQTQRVHLFPFRTQKLSSAVAKILYGRLYGKIAQCQHGKRAERSALYTEENGEKLLLIKNGGVAQLGEHLPCKQGVMGSNPIISTMRYGIRESVPLKLESLGFEQRR